MYAKNANPADKVMNLTNEGTIDVNATSTTDSSVAMMADNTLNTLATDKLVLNNKKDINLSGEKAIGMLLINATGNNTGSSANINVTNKNTTGVFAKAGSKFKADGTVSENFVSALSAKTRFGLMVTNATVLTNKDCNKCFFIMWLLFD